MRLDVARSRLTALALEFDQIDPAHRGAHRGAHLPTQFPAHPRRHGAPQPGVPFGRRATDCFSQFCQFCQFCQLLSAQQRRSAMRMGVLPIAHAVSACGVFGVVAFGDLANPLARIPRTLGDLLGQLST